MSATGKKNNNSARDKNARMRSIKKIVTEAWEKNQNPNFFGGCPVLDPSGRIVSIDIQALGFVAEVFEDEYINDKLVEAFRKNNIHYRGHTEEDIAEPIKKKVETWPPKPKLPVFVMTAYEVQSYFSQLIRHVNKLSGRDIPGGVAWGLQNKDAQVPEGWREDILEFRKYGGPGNAYEGKGKLTPRLKDLICSYFYLLGVDPNTHAQNIPEGYTAKNLDDLNVTTPPEGWVVPDWAGENVEEEEEEEDTPEAKYFA